MCHKHFDSDAKKAAFAKAACATLGQLYGEWITPIDEKGAIA